MSDWNTSAFEELKKVEDDNKQVDDWKKKYNVDFKDDVELDSQTETPDTYDDTEEYERKKPFFFANNASNDSDNDYNNDSNGDSKSNI